MERKMVGSQAGKTVQVARPTGKHRVDFRSSCERVAKSTTFNRQEVEAVLNATEIARDIVANDETDVIRRFGYTESIVQK